MDKKYNPYEDPSIHISQPETGDDKQVLDRDALNEAMKHYHIVNGHQMPGRMDHLPVWIRKPFRWFVILATSVFAVFIIRGCISNVMETLN